MYCSILYVVMMMMPKRSVHIGFYVIVINNATNALLSGTASAAAMMIENSATYCMKLDILDLSAFSAF